MPDNPNSSEFSNHDQQRQEHVGSNHILSQTLSREAPPRTHGQMRCCS